MRFVTAWRAIALATSLLFGGAGAVAAHALPDSMLTFSQEEDRLHLSLRLPLEDLTIAAETLEDLADLPVDQEVPAPQRENLSTYLARHLSLETGATEMVFDLAGAALHSAQNPDVGQYTLLVVDLTAPLPAQVDGTLFPLTLTYDAILHEVRTHRAMVYWTAPDQSTSLLARFGFQPLNGQQRPVTLQLP